VKINRSIKLAAVVLSVFVILSAVPLAVDAADKAAVKYTLTNVVKVEVKSIVNEKVTDGRRIGAVVRLHNQSAKAVRVPDYEVRFTAGDKTEYTLLASAVNAKVIQPKEKVELSYLTVVRRTDNFTLAKLSWIKVDEYVYPRKQTTMLSIPVSSFATTQNLEWGKPFKIPALSASLEFTPIDLFQHNTDKGSATIVTLQAANKGTAAETVPSFDISGKTDKAQYAGKKIEQDAIVLEPGEKQQIHFAIVTTGSAKLKSLVVMTSESFVEASRTTTYKVPRLNVKLPAAVSAAAAVNLLPSYEMGKPIGFDPLNKLINPDLNVSLVEFRLFQGEGGGYNSAIAKFKLDNRGASPVPVPQFAVELASADGRSYSGVRQNQTSGTVAPNVGYIVSYSFNLPNTETGGKLAMTLLDNQTAAPYRFPVAAFQTRVQDGTSDSLYPFRVSLADWRYVPTDNALKLNLNVQRESNVVVDLHFARLSVELVDQGGAAVAAASIPLTGTGRAGNGWQTIGVASGLANAGNLSLRIYETVDTPFGEARRLLLSSE